jgi:hypothetical protein
MKLTLRRATRMIAIGLALAAPALIGGLSSGGGRPPAPLVAENPHPEDDCDRIVVWRPEEPCLPPPPPAPTQPPPTVVD